MMEHKGEQGGTGLSRIELSVQCSNIPSKDTFSASDPLVAVTEKDLKTNMVTYRDITESIENNANPVFKKRLILEYRFEARQELCFEVYDMDTEKDNMNKVARPESKQGYLQWALAKQDFIGRAFTTLSEIVTARGMTLTLPLMSVSGEPASNPASFVTVTVSRINEDIGEYVLFDLEASSLAKMDWVGRGDPYCEVLRNNGDSTWSSVWKTEAIPDTREPSWKAFSVRLVDLCHNDLDRLLMIRVYDWDGADKRQLVGEHVTTTAKLIKTPEKTKIDLTRPGESTVNGKLEFTKIEKRHDPTGPSFLDFVKGGMRISLMVAIDFTGSNGHPMDKESLHYRGGATPNEYQRAIQAVGSVVQAYNSGGMFAAWGFGAIVEQKMSHCFPLSLNEKNTQVNGVAGVLSAYTAVLDKITFSGPTFFHQIIKAADSMASKPFGDSEQHYGIMLLITDGVLNDVRETTDAIVAASDHPLSIVIVGVGGADYAQMDVLTKWDTLKDAKGKKAARQIVQFQPMREFAKEHPSKLAEKTLKEVSKQMIEYCKVKGVKPMKIVHDKDDKKN
jgi:hypothetical protein